MRKRRYGSWILTGALVVLALTMAGCDQKTINEIKADPGRYADKEVGVVGTVTRSIGALGTGVYEIDDGTGKLWVVSKTGLPREGAKIGVKGTIRDGYSLGSLVKLPESISSGMVMIESSHKAR